MLKLNMHEAKTHLSSYIAHLKEGDVILLCKRNVPVAEVRMLKARKKGHRPVGLAKNKLKIPSSFFDSLPEDVLAQFEGKK